jgi:hypothetical protein
VAGGVDHLRGLACELRLDGHDPAGRNGDILPATAVR